MAKDQLLAVIWSHELSERKNELLDALSKRRIDLDRYHRLEGLHKSGAIAEREFQEAKGAAEVAEIAVAREERSLRARGVTAEEIKGVEAEAESLKNHNARTPFDPAHSWARTRLVSPIAGRLLEVSIVDGDLVATNDMLFRIADVRRLVVHVKVPEADLAQIEGLPGPVRWALRPRGLRHSEPLTGTIEAIGVQVDPLDHTAILSGRVANPDARLHPGQSVTAEIALPAAPDLIEIAASARLRDEGRDWVFVEDDPEGLVFTLRPIRVVREAPGLVIVRDDPTDGLEPDDRIVTEGAAKLKAALDGSLPEGNGPAKTVEKS